LIGVSQVSCLDLYGTSCLWQLGHRGVLIRTYVLGRHCEVTTLLSGQVCELGRSGRHLTVDVRWKLAIHMTSLHFALKTSVLSKRRATVH
jgi:hypothetical protein